MDMFSKPNITLYEQMNWKDGRKDGCKDVWIDGWMDECKGV